ncbi:hypothetical protein BDR03DRAFT_1018865 [Suillus americanus]|nr:hypothetical protein BDR03DRAFT_1018865 [Suillus americanus]
MSSRDRLQRPDKHPKYLSHIALQQLLNNVQAANVGIIAWCEQALTLHEGGFTCFDSIIDFSDVEAGSIAQIFQERRGSIDGSS